MKSDIEIAQAARLQPIEQVGAKLGIPADALFRYGPTKAKLSPDFVAGVQSKPMGKLVLVTAINPTPAGEGKTTTTIGLGDALARLGKKVAICLREPSLGPVFGMKGGAAGGGYSQVVPMEDINLHFTGDFHAIGSAHNLLSAMIDNHVYWANDLNLDLRRITWRRVMDMNDRALREIVVSLGGVANGFPRETGFDITVASEVMAILCLADGLTDLKKRLERIVVGETRDRKFVTAGQLKAAGAMAALLKDAILPNLVQTLEGTPAFVHGGPFANIAHGCNSMQATKTALRMAEVVVTEAGFGADLGAEKFFDIKCRAGGLSPSAAVIVATVRALKMHGGVKKEDLGAENVAALEAGLANLGRHIANVQRFGVKPFVGINRFTTDTPAEHEAIRKFCAKHGVDAFICSHWADGGKGAEELAKKVVASLEAPSAFKPLYDDSMPLWEKIRTIAKTIYGAKDATADASIKERLARFEKEGYGKFPICMAKTQYSFSTNPALRGAPEGHEVNVREVRLAAGAGFVVAITGDIMTMPGLPRVPAADTIGVTDDGRITGLF
ncbi:MAG: formate--tetrahydrofolate ligase [Alphaproteobacteria bacterium]